MLALVLVVVSLVELYSYIDSAFGEKLHLPKDGCSRNVSLSHYRPITFSLESEPDRYLVCGWTAGPTALRVLTALAGIAVGAATFLNLRRFKSARVQLATSGVAALTAALFFVALVVDANAVNVSTQSEVCVAGTTPEYPGKTIVCHAGRYIAAPVMDTLCFLLLGAYAVISFFYVRSGQFAIEVQADQQVDYFGEAERYFPDAGGDDANANLYE